jgi:hypothetical protein
LFLPPQVRVRESRETEAKMPSINEHRRTKIVVAEKAKRRMPMRPPEGNTNRGAQQAAPKADAVASDPPQSVASEGGAASPKVVDAWDVDDGTERPDRDCEISPGKDLDLRDGAGSSEGVEVPNDHGSAERRASTNGNLSQGKISDSDAITKYVDAIGGNWRRGVEAFLEIGRLCAEADERLDPAQQAELKAKLPFSAPTFSKFKQIGLDARLRKAEIQVFLPAAYTTIYAIACLKNDDDLTAAITEKIINPDMKRGTLEKWWKEREGARQRKADAQDDVAACPVNAVSVAAGNSVLGVTEPSIPGEVAARTVEAPPPVTATSSEPMHAGAGDVTNPITSVAPMGDENITSVLDGSSLSADDQAVLDLLNETWARASDPVRAQFRARIGE